MCKCAIFFRKLVAPSNIVMSILKVLQMHLKNRDSRRMHQESSARVNCYLQDNSLEEPVRRILRESLEDCKRR